jgi:hypothetical protein
VCISVTFVNNILCFFTFFPTVLQSARNSAIYDIFLDFSNNLISQISTLWQTLMPTVAETAEKIEKNI